MKWSKSWLATFVLTVTLPVWLLGQQQTSLPSGAVVPQLVNFSGRAADGTGKSITGTLGATFSIYQAQYGGSPLWMETQNVQTDAKGNYTVQLGANSSHGLPLDLFVAGEARWLAVRINGGEEQPRVLLLSVPYALKAADAQTLGGLPASAFVLAAPATGGISTTAANAGASASTPSPSIGGSGTQNYIPLWTDNTGDLGNSILYQLGSGSAAKIGINLKNPLLTLDVNGSELVRGLFEMATTGYATASKGYNSNPLNFESSAFSSSAAKYTLNHFQWQAEPTGNNTSSPGASLNLLYGTDPNPPAETGLKLSNKGIFTFASGQTFPGTGTVSSVGLSAPSSDFTVSGSPVTTSGTLGFNWTVAPTNADTANAIVKRDANGAFSSGEISAASVGTTTAAVTGTNTVSGIGVLGYATGTSGQGVWGESFGTNFAPNGQGSDGVHGQAHTHKGSGVAGLNSDATGIGVYGQGTGYYSTGTGFGVYGVGNIGVLGEANNASGIGVEGINTATDGIGVFGSGTFAGFFQGSVTVQGSVGATATDNSVEAGGNFLGSANFESDGIPFTGIVGTGGDNHGGIAQGGTGGYFTGGNNFEGGPGGDAIIAEPGGGGSGSVYAGLFMGDVDVQGNLSKGGGSFKIDHPLDPANKYLYHSFVESPDMKNVYDGVIQLDANGEAQIKLPEWFETLNRDFRYQLTCIGGFAPIYISREIANNEFQIAGGRPGMKVSWQVTGIRQDAWANAHRIPIEEEKSDRERGFYLHPELYGAPSQKNVVYARHPELLRPKTNRTPKVHAQTPKSGQRS